MSQVTSDIKKFNFKTLGDNNINFEQQQAIQQLQKNRDITIKMANKGGNVMVMDTSGYREMCLNILSNRDWCIFIPEESTQEFHNDYDRIVNSTYTNGIIDKEIFEALKVPYPRIPPFYSLPKTHKNMVKPSGHPIISGIGAKTEKGSSLVDAFLRPHVLELPSYIQDSMDLLRKRYNTVIPPDSILVFIDVEALYCSIPHSFGISMVETSLNEMDVAARPHKGFVV